MTVEAIRWEGNALSLLDQRRLPLEIKWLRCHSVEEVAKAISTMVVRGAPAIGITAAYGFVLARQKGVDRDVADRLLRASRPTAVNLTWALERMAPVSDEDLEAEAIAIHREDAELCRQLGESGADVLPSGAIYTHCNTGALATGGWGTALGIVRTLAKRGQHPKVYAGETRPYLQGARLTAWECAQEGIDCVLVADSMAGALMQSGAVSSVLVGCDRVAANGDVANKIGTYGLAVLARAHRIPFYVAMPMSTLDLRCATGSDIPVEYRDKAELRSLFGLEIAPAEVDAWNPAFDVTPAEWVTGWISEHGLWRP